MLSMIINLLMMILITYFMRVSIHQVDSVLLDTGPVIWKIYVICGTIVNLTIIPGAYIMLYFYVSLRFGRFICEHFSWDYEPLFDFIVLGIPDIILFCIYWGISMTALEPYGFWSSVGYAFKAVFSAGSVLSNVSAALVIFYPLCLCIKTPLSKNIMINYEDMERQARTYLHCSKIVDVFTDIAPGGASKYLRDSLHNVSAKTYGLKESIKLLKGKPRRVVTYAAVFIAISLPVGCFFVYEPLHDRMLDIGNQSVEGTRNYEEAFQLLEMINSKRGSRMPNLAMDASLMEAAMLRAAECSVDYSHTRPSGMAGTSVSIGARSEIIAVGQQDAEALMHLMMNPPQNVGLSAKYNHDDVFRDGRTSFRTDTIYQILMQNDVYYSVGIGFFEPDDAEEGEIYTVILFSRRISRNSDMPDNQEVSQEIRYRRTVV